MSSKQSNLFFVRTETNRNSICFGCFSVCFAKSKNFFFGLFRCFGPVSKQPKQTEFSRNKPKKSPKNVLYQEVLKTVNFVLSLNRNSICFDCFSVCFFAKPKNLFFGLFQFVSMFRTGMETTETNRTYGMGN